MEDMITKEQMQNMLNDLFEKGMSYDEAVSVLMATIGLYWKGDELEE